MRYNIEDLAYGGKYHDQFWNKKYNSEADVDNCLPNCTCGVIGFCLVENDPYPVSRVTDASEWDGLLINDWKVIDFDKSKVRAGDIIQWKEKCHVAKVADIQDGVIYVNSSFYTGENGVARAGGKYDTRDSYRSMEEVCRDMMTKYPARFYHCCSLDKESNMVGGQPEKILVRPMTLAPVDPDNSKDQVETTDITLRIRTKPTVKSENVGHVSIGYYDVLDVKDAAEEDKQNVQGLKCWYQIGENRWIANITTVYHRKDDGSDIIAELERYFESMKRSINALTDENTMLKEDIKKVDEITKRWVK